MTRLLVIIALIFTMVGNRAAAQNAQSVLKSKKALEAERALDREMEQRFGRAFAQRSRAFRIQPAPRNAPLRYENISDIEVREVEGAVWTVFPNVLVHIGPVVTGCPCEDGKACDAQVWVLAETTPVSRGVQLSRIGEHWVIGPVQRWWLEYEKRRGSNAEAALLERLPVCEIGADGA